MSSDVSPGAGSQPQQLAGRDAVVRSRWWKRCLLAIALLAVVASARALIPDAGSSRENGRFVTHTIARGDLTVSVTEQGTLESSDNTEIKCKVRGASTVIWVIEGGTEVKPGDELVRLDTLALEDAIAERTKHAHLTRSGAERARANAARAKLAISEYEEGRYRSQVMTQEKDLAIAESNLRTARDVLDHTEKLSERGYVSELELDQRTLAVTTAKLNVDVKKIEIEVLEEYTKKMELETLKGDLKAAEARLAAEEERTKADAERRDLAIEELEYCIVKAERSGMVIHPSAARWKNAPEIEEGATVHKDQILLLMPNLSKMQVKVGIHESIIERVKPGLAAKVTLPDKTLSGEVSSVAVVTRPAGWWTGNVVKYDTIVELPQGEELKPGMSAEVEVIIDRHEDVLMIPAAAVVETVDGDFCWVKTSKGVQRRSLELGDTDDKFVVIEGGIEEGVEVVLDPLAHIEEAQDEVLKPLDEAERWESGSNEVGDEPTRLENVESDHVE